MQFRDFCRYRPIPASKRVVTAPLAPSSVCSAPPCCAVGAGARGALAHRPMGPPPCCCLPPRPAPGPALVHPCGQQGVGPDGVLSASLVPDMAIASALAVMLAIAAMFLTRSLHPPGGAVALTAVIGGEGSGARGRLRAAAGAAQLPVAAESGLALQPRSGASLSPWRQGGAQSPPDGGSPAECPTRHPGHRLCPAKHGELLDISRQDLQELLQEAQLHALRGEWGRCVARM